MITELELIEIAKTDIETFKRMVFSKLYCTDRNFINCDVYDHDGH